MDLMEFLPSFYMASPEVTGIQRAFGGPVEDLWQAYDTFMAQLDVSTSTWGLRYWEEQYGLTTDVSKPLEERRARVLSKMRGQGTTTVEMVQNVAKGFANGAVSVREFPASHWFELEVWEKEEQQSDLRGLGQAIGELRPAHLDFLIRDLPPIIVLSEAERFQFQQLGIHIPISNIRQAVVLLDGRSRLGGDWLLNQALQGIAFPAFQVAGLSWHTTPVWQMGQFAMHITIPIVIKARLQQIGVHIPFRNYLQEVVLLDGKRRLKGDWLLNQTLQCMAFPMFKIGELAQHTTLCWKMEQSAVHLSIPVFLGAKLQQIEMYIPFYNYHQEITLLDGSQRLTGSWLLEQTLQGILFHSFRTVLNFKTRETECQHLQLTAGWSMNQEHIGLQAAATFTLPVPTATNLDTVAVSGIKATWVQQLTAHLIMDGLYHLDSEIPLDGRRKLNANIREEQL